jgi:hypothetical protein
VAVNAEPRCQFPFRRQPAILIGKLIRLDIAFDGRRNLSPKRSAIAA